LAVSATVSLLKWHKGLVGQERQLYDYDAR
jgi:hypothetical protein